MTAAGLGRIFYNYTLAVVFYNNDIIIIIMIMYLLGFFLFFNMILSRVDRFRIPVYMAFPGAICPKVFPPEIILKKKKRLLDAYGKETRLIAVGVVLLFLFFLNFFSYRYRVLRSVLYYYDIHIFNTR